MQRLKSETHNLKLRFWRRAAALVVVILALTASTPAFAQGCAMCYNTASAASPAAIQALRSGILILTFPPALIFITILILLLRRRNHFDEEPEFAASEVLSRELESLEPASTGTEHSQTAELGVSNFEFREPDEDVELAASTANPWK